jgi:hypothetical protein
MIRWCKDIDMFAIDRPKSSCLWKTKFCKEHCYNNKFYKMAKIKLELRDKKNETFYSNIFGTDLNIILSRKRKPTDRFRLCTRGEPITGSYDIYQLKDWARYNPRTQFWVPTRAWRNTNLKCLIEKHLFNVDNVFIQASLDPSNTQAEVDDLIKRGWSTSFFGNDNVYPFKNVNYVKCPLKWSHTGSCSTCTVACFNPKQTHHWLKEH